MSVLEEITDILPEGKQLEEIKELYKDYEITLKVFDTYYNLSNFSD